MGQPTARQIADYAFQHINGNSAPFNIQSSQQTSPDLSSKDEINEIQAPEGQANSSFELRIIMSPHPLILMQNFLLCNHPI